MWGLFYHGPRSFMQKRRFYKPPPQPNTRSYSQPSKDHKSLCIDKNSNATEEKDRQSFLKDVRTNNIDCPIFGQLNTNSLGSKFEQSSMISCNIDIFMIS